MINVLFLAMEYPPLNTAGVFRSLKFTKYLRRFGINPVVLTLEASDAADAFGAGLDPKLLGDIPADLDVVRTPSDRIDRHTTDRLRAFLRVYFRIEDDLGAAWWPHLDRRLPELVARYRPSAIYVSMPPFSSGRVAVRIARRFRLPLIVDMRDGWSQWRVGPFGSWLHYWLTLRRERLLFRSAQAVLTVTPQLADMFARAHPRLPKEKFRVVTNGYDFPLDLPQEIAVSDRPERTPLVIGYIGSFYYEPEARAAHFTPWWRKKGHRMLQYSPVKEDWLYRSPYFFLRAVAHLYDRRPELRGLIKFKVMGSDASWLNEMAKQHGVENDCEFTGRRTYAEALQFQSEVDTLLCTAVKVPGGEDYAIASKTFDYLRAGKPILGFVPVGSQRNFLLASGVGAVVDPDDAEAGARLLETMLQGGLRLRPNKQYLRRFHREELSQELARIIHEIVGPSDAVCTATVGGVSPSAATA